MDISSGYTTSAVHNTTQHAIPTSVITPTTSLANGWLDAQTNNLHGGFVPPPVSSSSGVYAIPTSAIRSVPQHQQRLIAGAAARITKEDLDLLRMSPSNSRRRIRDEEVRQYIDLQLVLFFLNSSVLFFCLFIIFCGGCYLKYLLPLSTFCPLTASPQG